MKKIQYEHPEAETADYGEFVSVIADIPVDVTENLCRELDELRARKIIINWEKINS